MADVEWIQDCNVASQIPQIDMDLVQWTTNSNTLRIIADFFLDALASLDLKLSVGESMGDSPSSIYVIHIMHVIHVI